MSYLQLGWESFVYLACILCRQVPSVRKIKKIIKDDIRTELEAVPASINKAV